MLQVLVDGRMLAYHLYMNWHEVWGVLKWVLVILAAGFVGQFGKSLALYFIKRHRNKQALEAISAPTGTSAVDANEAKIEKKRAKAKVKRLKKS
ncbi:hypothetical protein KAH43_04315 [Candidatus Bipolaricaulota bacterium]|nr:hypothetical protein [Candidatus Bipolaricaulota bacterium]